MVMRRGMLAVLCGVVVAVAASSPAGAADNWVGNWKLNVARSKYSPGAPPKNGTARIEAWVGGLKTITDGVDADGKVTHTEFAAKFDGKDYPYKGNPNITSISVRRIDDDTYEYTLKGKIHTVTRSVVSKDGKSRTMTQTGTNAEGKAVANTVVWDRQ